MELAREERIGTVLSATASFRILTENMPRTLERAAAEPAVARQTEYYLANIGNVDTIEQFLGDFRLFSYAMKAHGLEDMTYAKAFMRKVLEEGIDSPDSFANTLVDKRYRDFAEAFNFQRYGATATTFERTQQGTVDRFVRQTVEQNAGEQNEGVRLALYFQRKAPEVDSAYGLMGDRALLKVTQVLLGLSEATGALNIERQAELIGDRLDIADLKAPEKLDEMVRRFTSLWELQNGSGFSLNSASTILIGGGTQFGISGDLLASIQNLRLGGF